MSTLKKNSKKNKQSLKDKVDKSVEPTKDLSEANKKHISEVLNSTKKIIDSIKEKLDQQEIEDTLISVSTSTDQNPEEIIEEIVEESVDAVVNSSNSQLEINMDFNTEESYVTVNETSPVYLQKMIDFMQVNLERSQQFSMKNAKGIFDLHTKNTNLAVNMNQQLVEKLNTQVQALFNLQNENWNKYTNWLSEMLGKRGK